MQCLSFLFVAGDCMALLVEASFHRYDWHRPRNTNKPSQLLATIFLAICGDAKMTSCAQQGKGHW